MKTRLTITIFSDIKGKILSVQIRVNRGEILLKISVYIPIIYAAFCKNSQVFSEILP